jgi:hypothetical protein
MPYKKNNSNTLSNAHILVAEACISLTEEFLSKYPEITVIESQKAGQELFAWLKLEGGLRKMQAPLAVRSVKFGIRAIDKFKDNPIEHVTTLIKDTFGHYTYK